jgi:hypothetical protein
MIRSLKILSPGVLALIALSVTVAPSAQAAEFHCSVEPCRYTLKPDGTGKTAHQVFVVKNSAGEFVTATCSEAIGQATTATKTAAELTFTSAGFGLGCAINGSAASLRMNGCNLVYGASGTFGIKGCGKAIEIAAGSCVVSLPEQTVSGVKFHNVGEESKTTTELTIEIAALSMTVTAAGGKAGCGFDPTKTPITSEFKTGNVIVTGETDPGGVMGNAWWA